MKHHLHIKREGGRDGSSCNPGKVRKEDARRPHYIGNRERGCGSGQNLRGGGGRGDPKTHRVKIKRVAFGMLLRPRENEKAAKRWPSQKKKS